MPLLRPPPLARGAELRGAELRGAGAGRALWTEPDEPKPAPDECITGREWELLPLLLMLLPLLLEEEDDRIRDELPLRLPPSEPEKPALLGPQPELPRW